MSGAPRPAPVAVLPMYDWPDLVAETDRLWACLRDALRAEGVAAPQRLTREADHTARWLDPGLVLGQTCGLPYVERLGDRVTLLGAPDYGVEGCPPGWYRSEVVVRAGDAREGLAAFRGAHLALNGALSQSGHAALAHEVAAIAGGRFFGQVTETGSHAASALAVARGAADIAAIDAVTWRFLRRFRPETAGLRVLLRTVPAPGLPYIAAAGTDPAPHRRAVAAGIAALDGPARAALGLRGFVPMAPADYAVIRARFAAARARVTIDRGAAG